MGSTCFGAVPDGGSAQLRLARSPSAGGEARPSLSLTQPAMEGKRRAIVRSMTARDLALYAYVPLFYGSPFAALGFAVAPSPQHLAAVTDLKTLPAGKRGDSHAKLITGAWAPSRGPREIPTRPRQVTQAEQHKPRGGFGGQCYTEAAETASTRPRAADASQQGNGWSGE